MPQTSDHASAATSTSMGPASASDAGLAGERDAGGGASIDARQQSVADIDEPPPRVAISDGDLEGRTLSGGVRGFFGIPYAKPPVGALRFRAPEQNESWSASRDASSFGHRCAQRASSIWHTAASVSEDCLYLNVWAPAQAEKKPVLVFIHGGNHASGSASDPPRESDSGLVYDGQYLAAQGLVVVTFDYRLGVLGFFAHAALSGEGGNGNQGLRDQQLALRWVQDNIEAFGGDATRVSVFGESSGAVDVCFHVASPSSRDLFAGAIGASGGCTTLQTSLAQAESGAADLVTQLGCTGPDPLACLRAKSVSELLDATSSDSASDSSFGPIVDGDLMPKQPRALFDAGAIAKVPYLLGSDTDDGTLLTQGQPAINTDADLRTALTRMFTVSTAQILQRYPSSAFANAPNRYNATYIRIVGDARSVCPTWDVAQRAAAAGSVVYMFNFDVPTDNTLGATQGAELAYVFGSQPQFTPKTQTIIDRLQTYWSAFAMTGDPNDRTGLLVWPVFSDATSTRINFASNTTIKPDFRADECELWRSSYNAQFSAANVH